MSAVNTRDDYKDDIKKILCREILSGIEEDAVTDDRMLIQEGVLHSIAIMRLISCLTDRYQIELDDDDFKMENFETINDINKLLTAKINNGQLLERQRRT